MVHCTITVQRRHPDGAEGHRQAVSATNTRRTPHPQAIEFLRVSSLRSVRLQLARRLLSNHCRRNGALATIEIP